ncbi:hypothetical protein O181_035143 [Austropuccinia psidii MF-1]|uniref:NUDE domain-containing protein n=1 Tax=Austropuccinia psidii MF-1 TaxID=1389203 RepID=A0A9Q3H804_9BASI|nr:hypothetical protein [Austropuccinia psidii MF-1]
MDEKSNHSDVDQLEHYRNLARSLQFDLEETKLALDEFQISSKELETELEKELQGTEKQLKELKGKEESLLNDIDHWKTKFHSSLKDHTKTMTIMQTELDTLRKSNEQYRTRLRDMELDNDELEGKERMVTSSLQDVESKYGKAIERITLLEDELIEKSRLEEECQRLKDDLRDTTEELAILREQLANHQFTSKHSSSSTTQPQSSPSSASSSNTQLGPQTPLSEPTMEILKDDKDIPSPLRALKTIRPIATLPKSQDSPRRRLASLNANSSSPKLSSSPKPVANMNIKKVGSLRARFSPSPSKVFIQDILSPSARTNVASSTTMTTNSTRNQSRTGSLLPKISSNNSPSPQTGRSHLQSLRAETERLQGMKQKLVSSRNLRAFSAIPIPKSYPHSTLPTTKAGICTSLTLNRSTTGSGLKKISTGPSAPSSKLVMEPVSLDQSSRYIEANRTNLNRSQGEGLSTMIPRPKLARPSSRLSMGHDQNQPLGIPNSSNRSITPTAGIPRRKASMDYSEKFIRPLSTQGHYMSHLRRKSAGFQAGFNNDHQKSNVHHGVLGKSFGGSVSRSNNLCSK